MRYETYQFILKNKRRFALYDNATGSGSDTTNDASASSVNPNNFLAPLVSSKLKKVLIAVALILVIIYLFKKIL